MPRKPRPTPLLAKIPADALRNQIEKAEIFKANLLRDYGENHKVLDGVNKGIANMQAELARREKAETLEK